MQQKDSPLRIGSKFWNTCRFVQVHNYCLYEDDLPIRLGKILYAATSIISYDLF